MIHIKKTCWYAMKSFSVFPGIVITPKEEGVVFAFKLWFRHAGVEISWAAEEEPMSSDAR